MPAKKPHPGRVIRNSSSDAQEDDASRSADAAERLQAKEEANVARHEAAPALSFVANIFGVGEDARNAYYFLLFIILICALVTLILVTTDQSRASIIDLLKMVVSGGVGWVSGRSSSRRR